MNPYVGWALAAAALIAGWAGWGWQGLVLAVTVIVFWLLLQFNRAMRVMRNAAQRPVGWVPNAVMLHAKLKPGQRLLDVIVLTGSLGKKVSEAPETWRWADEAGDAVLVEVDASGRVRGHSLVRA